MAINLPIISEWNPAGINKAINDFKKLETTGQKASFAIKKAAVPAGLALAALGKAAQLAHLRNALRATGHKARPQAWQV